MGTNPSEEHAENLDEGIVAGIVSSTLQVEFEMDNMQWKGRNNKEPKGELLGDTTKWVNHEQPPQELA